LQIGVSNHESKPSQESGRIAGTRIELRSCPPVGEERFTLIEKSAKLAEVKQFVRLRAAVFAVPVRKKHANLVNPRTAKNHVGKL